MAVLDDDFSVGATLVEGGDGVWLPPKRAAAGAPHDFQSLYEQQRSRAEAAEARCEELRWAEVAARSDAGSWKSCFTSCRRRLSEAVEEAKDLRRAAKSAAPLRAALARLETLLSEAGIGSSEIGTIEALVKEVAQLREILAEPEGAEDIVGWHSAEARPDRASSEEARLRVTIKTLRKDITRLNREVGRGNRAIDEFHKKLDEEKERAESIRETAKELSRENLSLHRETRILGEQAAKVRAMSDEAYRLRLALDVSEAGKKKLATRIARLRAVGATLSKLPFDEAAHLRNVLRRARRQKTAIRRQHKENARLRNAVKVARTGRAASGSAPCRASHCQEDPVGVADRHGHRAAAGSAPVASSEGDGQVAVQGERAGSAGVSCRGNEHPRGLAGVRAGPQDGTQDAVVLGAAGVSPEHATVASEAGCIHGNHRSDSGGRSDQPPQATAHGEADLRPSPGRVRVHRRLHHPDRVKTLGGGGFRPTHDDVRVRHETHSWH